MKKNRLIVMFVLIIVTLCAALTACGRATMHRSISCINYSHDLSFDATVTAKYGSADPMRRILESNASITKIADKIRADNADLAVSVESDVIFVGVKSGADNGFTKPRVAIIKTGDKTYLQTAMSHCVGNGEIYIDYGVFDVDYQNIAKEGANLTGIKLKLRAGYDQTEVLRLYGLWNFTCAVADEATPNVVAVTNTHFNNKQSFTFTFSTEGEVTYLTIT